MLLDCYHLTEAGIPEAFAGVDKPKDDANVVESTAQEIPGGLFPLPHARGRA